MHSRTKLKTNDRKIISQPSPTETARTEPQIQLRETILENVDHLPRVGRHLSSDNDHEIIVSNVHGQLLLIFELEFTKL